MSLGQMRFSYFSLNFFLNSYQSTDVVNIGLRSVLGFTKTVWWEIYAKISSNRESSECNISYSYNRRRVRDP